MFATAWAPTEIEGCHIVALLLIVVVDEQIIYVLYVHIIIHSTNPDTDSTLTIFGGLFAILYHAKLLKFGRKTC